MKFLVPLSLSVFLIACAAPVDKAALHQRQLWEQARANYIAMGGRVHSEPAPTPAPHLIAFQQPPPPPPPAPTPRPRATFQKPPPPPPAPTPRPFSLFAAFQPPPPPPPPPAPRRHHRHGKFAAYQEPLPPPPPAPTPRQRAKSVAQATPPPKSKVARNQAETVYYWQVGAPPRENTARYAAAEAKYARTLAKRPEHLTPEERVWAHEHY